jgi:hypothetical protein
LWGESNECEELDEVVEDVGWLEERAAARSVVFIFSLRGLLDASGASGLKQSE